MLLCLDPRSGSCILNEQNITHWRDGRPSSPGDTSNIAIGASLEQELACGTWRFLGSFFKKLSNSDNRDSAYDRELFVIFTALKHFQRFLMQDSDKASPRQADQVDYILQHPVVF